MPPLVNTRAGFQCSTVGVDRRGAKVAAWGEDFGSPTLIESALSDAFMDSKSGLHQRSLGKGAGGDEQGGVADADESNPYGCVLLLGPESSAWVRSMADTLQHMLGYLNLLFKMHSCVSLSTGGAHGRGWLSRLDVQPCGEHVLGLCSNDFAHDFCALLVQERYFQHPRALGRQQNCFQALPPGLPVCIRRMHAGLCLRSRLRFVGVSQMAVHG